MAIPKIIGAQRDFSAGQLNEALKRADESPSFKTGARQHLNFRVLSGGQITNRPGRRALFQETGRVEKIRMSPSATFYLVFNRGSLRVYNEAGAQVAHTHVKGDGYTALPWSTTSVNKIVFCVITGEVPQVYITYGDDYPNNVPLVLEWDGVSQTSTWTIANFTPATIGTGQVRTIFDRLSAPNITILPSGTTGTVTLSASDPVFVSGMVGTRLLWCGREVMITGYTDSKNVTANVIEPLPNAVHIQLGQFLDIGNGNSEFIPGINGTFLPGDLIIGSVSGARAIVISTGTEFGLAGTAQFLFYAQTPYVVAQIIPYSGETANGVAYLGTVGQTAFFTWKELVVGPNGNGEVGAAGLDSPKAVSVWDDEVMNNYRGWPRSCFYDQNRLGFCDFPVAPNGIAWSGIGLQTDFYVNGLATSINADNAIYEKAPGAQVQYVVPGMESSEFVFCSDAIFYIPISATNPLTPGSVAFMKLTAQGSYPGVKPIQIQQCLLYVRAGGASLGAVQTPGFYARPNVAELVSELHSDLLTASAPLVLAAPEAADQDEGAYAYLLRADGVIVTARYLIRNGLLEAGQDGKPKLGWALWNGMGAVKWLTALDSDLILTTKYLTPSVGDAWSTGFSTGFGTDRNFVIVEQLDAGQNLDCALKVNNLPAAIVPPGGDGPLWFLRGGTVYLYDGVRPLGIYDIDDLGNIVPQFQGGENLTSPNLIAGQPWTAILEPFVADAQPGVSQHQRMFKRRVSRMAVYVSSSSGFMMARLFSGPVTPGGPTLGTIMQTYRVPAYFFDDDATQPPPLRESAERWRPLGRAFDPRVAVIKDTPGPITIHEIGIEASI